MGTLSASAYIKQIAIYLQKEDYRKAYDYSREFAENFPEEMPSHYLLAKSAFWLGDFETSRDESLKAFNLSNGNDELAVTGIMLVCSYYQLRQYGEGMKILSLLKTRLPAQEDVMKLKFIFALALEDEAAAMRHLEELYSINRKEAGKMLEKLLEETG